MAQNHFNVSLSYSNDDTGFSLISLETRRRFEEVLSCGLLPVVFLVGLAGNIMSVIVLAYHGVKEVTNILLIGLTITDLLFILSSFAFEMECIVRPFNSVFAIRMEVWTQYYLFIPAFIIGRISGLFICLVALERYIVVRYPLKARRLVTRKMVTVLMMVTYLLSFSLCGCLLFIFDVRDIFDPDLNITLPKLIHSQFAVENLDFMFLYTDVFLNVTLSFFPASFVLILTCSIVRILRQSYQQRNIMTGRVVNGQTDTKRDAEQQKITKMLLSVCILFIVCTVPSIIYQTARLLFGKDGFTDVGQYQNITAVVASTVFLFSLINSSANFILYIATSKKFAATCGQLFLCGLGGGQKKNGAF